MCENYMNLVYFIYNVFRLCGKPYLPLISSINGLPSTLLHRLMMESRKKERAVWALQHIYRRYILYIYKLS